MSLLASSLLASALAAPGLARGPLAPPEMLENDPHRKACPELFHGAVDTSENFCSHKSRCPKRDYECVVGRSKGACDEYPWKTVDVTHCHKWCINRDDDDGLVPPASRARVPPTLVLSVASDKAITLVANNIRAQPALDFGVVLHHGQVAPWKPLYSVAKKTGNRFYVAEGMMPTGVDPHDHGFIPKLWFQAQATDWLKPYDYVWMVDEDMSFHFSFSYPEFWRRHQEEFPQGPPLVAQPTIRQNTQFWPLLTNAEVYPCETRAAVTTYVEQQVPIFDAKFWLWLVPRMDSLKLRQVKLANDWVTDHVWCRAAEAYDKSRTACAVITTPINTADTDTSGWQSDQESFEKFLAAGLSLGDWACKVAKHQAEKDDSTLGNEWATYAVSDQPLWPPKATLLIPPLPPDSPEGGLPFPFWNDASKNATWWNSGQGCSVAMAARAMAHALRGRRDGKRTLTEAWHLPTIGDGGATR